VDQTKTLRDLAARPVPIIEPRTALDEAIRLMREEPLRMVALVEAGTYMGVFNQKALDDSNLIPAGVDRSLLEVGPYIHSARVVGRADMPVGEALALMARKGLDVIPVLDNNAFRGVVTRDELEKALN
jgi:predicted transcriptional regulator